MVDREDLRCVLIDPPAASANVYEDCNVKRALEHHAVYPPIGLAYIAAVLRESGINVTIIDARSLDISHEDIAEAVGNEKADFVGITVLTPQLKSALDLSRKIKSDYPFMVLVLGGPHIHFQHREVIKEDYVDFCVRGEGEYSMMELIHVVSDEDKLSQVKGITFKENNKVIVTPDRPLIQNLDDLPFPARDLLPNHVYKGGLNMGDSETFTSVLSSRGCPFRCHFCAASSMWRIHRRRSIKNVLQELKEIRDKFNIKSVRFADDLFCARRKWVIKFCEEMIEQGLDDIAWSCDGRVGIMTREMIQAMKRANCRHIFYGIEFGNQRLLGFSRKGTTIQQIRETVKMTKEAEISAYGYFMIGYPTETKETIEDTITLARALGLDHAGFSMVTPFPGTQLYEYCKANSLLKTTDWNQYSMIQPGKGVIKLRNVTDEELMDLYYKAHREFRFRHVREGLRQEFRDWGLLEEDVPTAHRAKPAT